ncbi:hypothetical protein ACH5RR_011912 [Cinchona calisaya]|uniref:Maturase K n=1 Tax=Cinchona calisaya TaxID=153742 RepID=A0ABD3A689_9GENT
MLLALGLLSIPTTSSINPTKARDLTSIATILMIIEEISGMKLSIGSLEPLFTIISCLKKNASILSILQSLICKSYQLLIGLQERVKIVEFVLALEHFLLEDMIKLFGKLRKKLRISPSYLWNMGKDFKFSTTRWIRITSHIMITFLMSSLPRTGFLMVLSSYGFVHSVFSISYSDFLLSNIVCRSNVEDGGETVFPSAKGNISAVPWWNELSECGKVGCL